MYSGLISKRVAWFSRLLFFTSVMLGMVSCASYDYYTKNPQKLTKASIYRLDGVYEATSIVDSLRLTKNQLDLTQLNFLKTIDREDTLVIDPGQKYTFIIKINSPKSLTVSFLRGGDIYGTQTIKTRLSNSGYLHLRNNNLEIWGVPILFGGYNQQKTRLSLDQNNVLLVDTCYDSFGSVFIFMMAGHNSSNRTSYLPYN